MSSVPARRVLVIAAHPDDELLGVGGTLAVHIAAGDHVTCLVAAAGELLHDIDGELIVHGEGRAAAVKLGIQDLRFLSYSDQRLDTLSLVEIITSLESVVAETKPQIVYVQWGGDINKDHKLLFEAALVALRPVEAHIEAIYAFDTVSSTEWAYPRNFVPDTWVDISDFLDLKLAAIACYESELRSFPHPRSLHALRAKAELTGSQVCASAAEALMTIRRVIRNGKTTV